MSNFNAIALLTATLRIATPLIFAALGRNVFRKIWGSKHRIRRYDDHRCIFFLAVYGTYASGSPLIGIVCAMIAGGILALIHAVLSINLKADQVISGTAINLFSTALPAS